MKQETILKPNTQKKSNQFTAVPETNIRKVDTGIIIEIDLPGVIRDKLSLNVEQNILKLEAYRATSPNEGSSLVSSGPTPEQYKLNLKLSDEIDSASIKATFRNGVLVLDAPRKESSLPKEIAISA